jgi:hypothetical protein
MQLAFRLMAAALIAVPVARARNSLEPFFLRGFGSTLYRLELTFPMTGAGRDSIPENVKGIGQSELEYPLDVFVAGLRYRHEIALTGRSAGLNLGAWINVNQPSAKMRDSDWFGARASAGSATSTVLFKFSYTESRAEVNWLGGEAGADFGDFALFGKPVRYGLSVRAERFAYRLFGVEGWQRALGEPPVEVDSFTDEKVLTYGLTRIAPRLFADFRLAEGSAVGWKAVFSGAPAFAFDHDDHILRHKESDTFAFGFEAGASTELSFRLTAQSRFTVAADVAYLRTKGKMDQRFYGDDPFTTDKDETGTRISGVETRIIGFAGSLSAGVRYLF